MIGNKNLEQRKSKESSRRSGTKRIKRWNKTEEDENQEKLKPGEQIKEKTEITREKWKSRKMKIRKQMRANWDKYKIRKGKKENMKKNYNKNNK